MRSITVDIYSGVPTLLLLDCARLSPNHVWCISMHQDGLTSATWASYHGIHPLSAEKSSGEPSHQVKSHESYPVLSNPIALEMDSRLLIIGFPQGQAVHLGLKLARLTPKQTELYTLKHTSQSGSCPEVKEISWNRVVHNKATNWVQHLPSICASQEDARCAEAKMQQQKNCSAFQIKNSNYLNLSDLLPCIPCWCLNHVSFATGDRERPST